MFGPPFYSILLLKSWDVKARLNSLNTVTLKQGIERLGFHVHLVMLHHDYAYTYTYNHTTLGFQDH